MEVATNATLNKFLKKLAYQEEGLVKIIKNIVDIFIGINYKWYYLHPKTGKFILYQDLKVQNTLEIVIGGLPLSGRDCKLQISKSSDIFVMYTNNKSKIYVELTNYSPMSYIRDITRICRCPKCYNLNLPPIYYNKIYETYTLYKNLHIKYKYKENDKVLINTNYKPIYIPIKCNI